MNRWLIAIALFFSVAGCSGPTFRNIGRSRGAIPTHSIEEYARENDVSLAEAKTQLKAEADSRNIQEHAEKYGLTHKQAAQQLEYAGEVAGEVSVERGVPIQ